MDQDLPYGRQLPPPRLRPLQGGPVAVVGDRARGRSVSDRCDGYGAYSNPREMAEFSPGGRKDAFSGKCGACASTVPTGQREEHQLCYQLC